MKLWTVTCEVELLIACEKKPCGFKLDHAAAEAMKDNGSTFSNEPEEIKRLRDIPEEWLGCVPYGDERKLTCEQIVERSIEAAMQEALLRPMPNQTSLPLKD